MFGICRLIPNCFRRPHDQEFFDLEAGEVIEQVQPTAVRRPTVVRTTNPLTAHKEELFVTCTLCRMSTTANYLTTPILPTEG